LTAKEEEFIRFIAPILRNNDFSTSTLLELLLFIETEDEASANTLALLQGALPEVAKSALGKMADSHGMEHILHGLMQVEQWGWNVYDVPSPLNGGFNPL
ncbi:MAG: hypothetical protein O2856_15255, partial [Planctomycetota bacterium]|nr:hypothetical protein [Planctomycetota bacterium]